VGLECQVIETLDVEAPRRFLPRWTFDKLTPEGAWKNEVGTGPREAVPLDPLYRPAPALGSALSAHDKNEGGKGPYLKSLDQMRRWSLSRGDLGMYLMSVGKPGRSQVQPSIPCTCLVH